MKNFKLTPKIALIIVLVLITIAGVYLYLNTNGNSKKTQETDNKGFMSFFGDRKVKPVDETTVPGVTPTNTVGSNTSGSIDAGDVDLNNGSNIGGGSSGNLSLKPIGVNTIPNGGSGSASTNTTGGTGTDGRFTSGATGGNTTGGNGTTGGTTGTNVNPPPEQVNCTPKEIEFTEAEKKKLKELEARFYQVAAEIKTEQDVETLVRTRQNYYNYLSSDYSSTSRKDGTGVVELTKQCFTERNKSTEETLAYKKEAELRVGPGFDNSDLDKKYPLANKPLGLRPSPFITQDMFNKMASVPPLRWFMNRDKLKITTEIKEIEKEIQAISAASASTNRLPLLQDRLIALKELLKQLNENPFSYFANNTTYVVYEEPTPRETKLSRLNSVYQNLQTMFYSTFGASSEIVKIFWASGDWSKAANNPVKDSGFAIPCDSVPIASKTTMPLVCYENSYPMQNLERFLGIW